MEESAGHSGGSQGVAGVEAGRAACRKGRPSCEEEEAREDRSRDARRGCRHSTDHSAPARKVVGEESTCVAWSR